MRLIFYRRFVRISFNYRSFHAQAKNPEDLSTAENPINPFYSNPFVEVLGRKFSRDSWTNLTPKIVSLTERQLFRTKGNPLFLLRRRIEEYFYRNFRRPQSTSPLFTILDNFSPIVSVKENFDQLLIPGDHPSRQKSDSYYLNQDFLLRSHTSAHEHEIISSGLDAYILVGDCYRR